MHFSLKPLEKNIYYIKNCSQVDGDQDSDGKTALMLAAFYGHTDVVQVLLRAGAGGDLSARVGSLNTQSKDGSTALLNAAFRGHHTIVR